ncbi:MAG: hypothetical protein JSU92_01685 [Deltaproteobacteria bacterium]|nr:MAG: hypothetical protein JSU92_01685 [Deltaproteobacteria bacterium]
MRKKIYQVLLALILLGGCGPSLKEVDLAMSQAENAYALYMRENPPADKTMSYRMLYSQALKEKEKKNYPQVFKLSNQAKKEAENGLLRRKAYKKDVEKKLARVKQGMEQLLHPSPIVVEAYFAAYRYYKEKNYEKVEELCVDAQKRIDLDKSTSFLDTVVLKCSNEYQQRYGGIPVYSFIGKDGKLHEVKGMIENGTKVKFLRKYFLSQKTQFYQIQQTTGGSLEGWVYQLFVSE